VVLYSAQIKLWFYTKVLDFSFSER